MFNANGASKNKIYGRFAQFLIHEQVDQGRLRVFFAVRDDAKRVARFDLHPGEVQAFQALAKRSRFASEQVDLLLRDDLSLSVALNVPGHGLRFDVQTPLWRSQFAVSKANDVATLSVFTRCAINQEKTVPIRFGDEANQFSLRRRNDGQVVAEFQHQNSIERIPLSTLQLYQLEILAQYALYCAFEPVTVTPVTYSPREISLGLGVDLFEEAPTKQSVGSDSLFFVRGTHGRAVSVGVGNEIPYVVDKLPELIGKRSDLRTPSGMAH